MTIVPMHASILDWNEDMGMWVVPAYYWATRERRGTWAQVIIENTNLWRGTLRAPAAGPGRSGK